MWLFVWEDTPRKVFLWDAPYSKVFVWDKQVRPSSQPITEIWIYWSESLWVISFQTSAWNGISIADKDLWATTVLWQGNWYQWGNNHPREYWVNPISTSTTLVNASAYWPWNYYNSSTFIINNEYWDSSINNNLWWWTTNTYEARRWPCVEWWHIPSLADFTTLVNAISSITWSVNWTKITNYCKLKNMYTIVGITWEWATAWWWNGILSSDVIYVSGKYRQRLLYVSWNSYNATNEHFSKWNWWQYRAFSNIFIQPTTSRIKLNSLQNINLTPTNEINITPNNNGSGNVQTI